MTVAARRWSSRPTPAAAYRGWTRRPPPAGAGKWSTGAEVAGRRGRPRRPPARARSRCHRPPGHDLSDPLPCPPCRVRRASSSWATRARRRRSPPRRGTGRLRTSRAARLCDLKPLLNGGFSPLTGSSPRAPTPPSATACSSVPARLWPLRDPKGVMLAVLHVEDIRRPDREAEAEAVFSTTNREHPGVAGVPSGRSRAGARCSRGELACSEDPHIEPLIVWSLSFEISVYAEDDSRTANVYSRLVTSRHPTAPDRRNPEGTVHDTRSTVPRSYPPPLGQRLRPPLSDRTPRR